MSGKRMKSSSSHPLSRVLVVASTTTIATLVGLLAVNVSVVDGGWVDPDTPQNVRKISSLVDGSEYNLVS